MTNNSWLLLGLHSLICFQMSSSDQKSDEPEYLSAVESHALSPSTTSQHAQDMPQEVGQHTNQDHSHTRASYSANEQALNQNMAPYSSVANVMPPQYAISNNNNSSVVSGIPQTVQNSSGFNERHHQEGFISG